MKCNCYLCLGTGCELKFFLCNFAFLWWLARLDIFLWTFTIVIILFYVNCFFMLLGYLYIRSFLYFPWLHQILVATYGLSCPVTESYFHYRNEGIRRISPALDDKFLTGSSEKSSPVLIFKISVCMYSLWRFPPQDFLGRRQSINK